MPPSVRKELVRLSRWLEKNNGLYLQIISDTAMYSIGDGIHMQACGGDFDWQSLIEAEWEQECESPEVTGRFSMLECLNIICRAIDRDGEIFIVKCKRNGIPKFQMVESHRIETPSESMGDVNVSDGIMFNKFGQPVKYFIKQSDGRYVGVNASSVIHIFHADHASQARAYPPHQHAIVNIRDEIDLLAMEKVAAKDNSRLSRILKTNDPTPDSGDVGLGISSTNTGTDTGAFNRILGGVTAVLQPNEELVAHQPARPTSAFTGFIEHLRRDSTLGSLPYEFIADPTKAGGTAVRLVVAKASRYFNQRQNVIIHRFLDPYFKFWLGTKITRGDLPTAKNWWKADWMTTRSVTVDAGRDAANERADLEMGRNTLEDDFASRGLQFEKAMRKRAKNFLFIEKLAQDTNLSRDDLFRFSPQGGGASGAPMLDKNGNPIAPEPVVPAGTTMEEISDKVGESMPELKEPNVGDGVSPATNLTGTVDELPKQYQGISRSLDQPYL